MTRTEEEALAARYGATARPDYARGRCPAPGAALYWSWYTLNGWSICARSDGSWLAQHRGPMGHAAQLHDTLEEALRAASS